MPPKNKLKASKNPSFWWFYQCNGLIISISYRGQSQTTFTRFVSFDHLPPYGIKVYKKSIFLTTYPPLVNVVCERPLRNKSLTLNLKLGTFYWQQLVSWYPLSKLHAPVITQAVITDRVPNKVGGKLIPFIVIKRVGKHFLGKNKVSE